MAEKMAADIETKAAERVGSMTEGQVKDFGSSDYDEWLRLQEVFVGDKLKTLTRKIDMRILPQLIFLYLLCYIDRSNAGNVKLFGALPDMKLSGQDWNTALCVFFATYSLGAAPSNIALKRWGANLWLPTLLTICGVLNVIMGVNSTFGGLVTLRLLLGLVEAGVYPGCSYVLTQWYSPEQVHGRLTTFYSGASLASAFSGLLAYAIGHLDNTWGYRGWRWIYVIEGLFSVFVGICMFFVLSPSPSKVKSWLTPEEKRFLVLRHRFGRVTNAGAGETEVFSRKYVKQAFKSFHVYAIGLTEFTVCTAVYGISFVLPSIIKQLGYSALKAQAMSAPPYVFACFAVFLSGWAADRFQQRMLSLVIPNTFACLGFVIIIATVRYPTVPGVTYFGIFLMAGGLYCLSPAVSAWTALNTAGDMKRAVSMALMISIGQLGGILGSNIFLAWEAPTYNVGFGLCLAMLVAFGVVWPIIYWMVLRRINAKRAAMSPQEIAAKYSEQELVDMGDLSPLFRYAT